MPRWRKLTCHIAPMLFAGAIGAFLVLLFGNRDPTDVSPIVVEPAVITPGGVGYITFSGRENLTCEGVVHRWIVSSGVVFDLTDAPIFRYGDGSSSPATVTFNKEFPVPLAIKPGPAVYHSMAVRWCNPIQQFLWPVRNYYQAKFMVGKPAG